MYKKILLLVVALGTSFATAQTESYLHTLKVGGNAGVSIPQENTSFHVGLDVNYQYLVTPKIGIGLSSGYNQYFGRDNDGIDNNDVGLIPVAALFRYYPNEVGFYIGTDIGYAALVGDEQVASNSLQNRPNGGFYIKPEVGYHNRDWNFALHYIGVFTDDANIGNQDYRVNSLGIGISYNIPLGN